MGPAFTRKYNTLTVTGTTAIKIPIIKRGAIDFAVGADWTPASGDVKVRIDGGSAANVTNLPSAVAMGNTAYWEFVLTAAELTGKSIVVTVSDSATKAIEDQCFIIETFGDASAMYQADLSAAALPANLTQVGGTAIPTPNVNGVPIVDIGYYNGDAVVASSGPVDASVTQWNGVNVATPDTAGYPKVTAKSGTGTGEISLSSGKVRIASDGLDSISTTAPTDVASNFREMLVAVWRSIFKKSTLTASELTTYADDGTTPITTQAVSDDGTTQTRGAAT